ncbi:hypothetical protein [Bradyrhizobium cosmicum]|uniref:hypothetical protein n=1 Tax=Bradyrhizobium cosmicum TaxID=1404864 RepID=UPI0028E86683|nr:hypothetical protein [Bradyrhizobium cosmicum]
MPHFIEKPVVNGRRIYVVANETAVGQNFAERWNTEPARVAAFYEWHTKALADFEALPNLQGIDVIGKSLESSLGSSVVRKAIDARTEGTRRRAPPRSFTSRRRSGSHSPARRMQCRFALTRSSGNRCFRAADLI